MNHKKPKNSKGFTIVEALLATFVITVGVVGVLAVVNQTTAFTQVTSSRLTAIYLAQEGIEIVKNIRDTNFLKVHKGLLAEDQWVQGLTGCEGGCEADYTDSTLSAGDRYFKIEGGFYKYSVSGTETSFKRKITVFDLVDLTDPPDDIIDQMKVLVEVSWEERGRTHQVAAQENVYKWW